MPAPLPLPDIRQAREWDCAQAAWRCVYEYHYERRPRIPNISNAIRGTDPATIEAVIRQQAGWHVLGGEMTVLDLQHFTANKRPVIALVTLPGHEGESHYVTVSGVYRGKVHYQCPDKGPQAMHEAEWLDCWHGRGNHASFERWGLCAWPV